MKLVASAQLVFAGSADTQIFLINERDHNFLISFSGFLSSTSAPLTDFQCDEIIIYQGANVKNIIDTTLKKSAENQVTEHHSFRQFDITPKLKELMVEWLFTSDTLMSMD